MQTRGLISTLFLMVLTLGSGLIDLKAESASGSYLLAPVPTPSPVRQPTCVPLLDVQMMAKA